MVSGVSSSSGAGRPVVQPANPQPSNPNPPHSSGVSSAGDSTWNGRKLRLVLEDNFSGSGVDTSKWEHEVSLWGGGVSMITCRSLLFDITFSSYVQTKLFIGFQG